MYWYNREVFATVYFIQSFICQRFYCKFISSNCIFSTSPACVEGSVLLYNGSEVSTEASQGTVLVCFSGVYGSICDDFWDQLEAQVICGQLGKNSTGSKR